jgi:hypothetical protein
MSNWTHIIGAIHVETYIERKNIKKYIEKIIKDAPKITGSEDDADVFINPLSDYNVSSLKEDKNGNYITYQTRVCITLVGNLRDRDINQTEKEYFEFINFIKEKEFDIYYSSVAIYEDWSGEVRQYRGDTL